MSLNTFIVMAVPGSGVGTAVDATALGAGPTMVVTGPELGGDVVLEISCDGGAHFAPVTQSLIPNPPFKVLKSKIDRDIADPQNGHPTTTGGIVAQYARIRRLSGSGASTAALSSPSTTNNSFATFSGNASIDTSLMGPVKTLVVCGSYDSPIVVEGSIDGTNYDAVAKFDTNDSDVKVVDGAFASMRVKSGSGRASGSVSVGAGFQDDSRKGSLDLFLSYGGGTNSGTLPQPPEATPSFYLRPDTDYTVPQSFIGSPGAIWEWPAGITAPAGKVSLQLYVYSCALTGVPGQTFLLVQGTRNGIANLTLASPDLNGMTNQLVEIPAAGPPISPTDRVGVLVTTGGLGSGFLVMTAHLKISLD